MARTADQIVREQIAGMVVQLAMQESRLETLMEENAQLKARLAELEPKKEEK